MEARRRSDIFVKPSKSNWPLSPPTDCRWKWTLWLFESLLSLPLAAWKISMVSLVSPRIARPCSAVAFYQRRKLNRLSSQSVVNCHLGYVPTPLSIYCIPFFSFTDHVHEFVTQREIEACGKRTDVPTTEGIPKRSSPRLRETGSRASKKAVSVESVLHETTLVIYKTL